MYVLLLIHVTKKDRKKQTNKLTNKQRIYA